MNENTIEQLLQAINTLQDLGKVAYFNKGAYNSETTYELNDVVTYGGGSYVSMVNENRGNLPTNVTYWNVVAEKGNTGETGKPFVIEKTYASIEDMVADYDNMNVNDYVMIQGNIEEEENATLWTKTETEVSPYKWVYLADFSGASGITGQTPNIQIGNVTEGNEPAVTRRAGSSNENPILDFVLKTGETGPTGGDGNGIVSVSKTSTSGLTDTYTITFTDIDPTTFDVVNGKGITSIAKTSTSGYVDTYTITYNDNTTSTFDVTNGEVSQAQLDETNERVERAEMVYNALPKVNGSGEVVTLDNTAETPLKMELSGNTSQESTNGYQEFNSSAITRSGFVITDNGKSIKLPLAESGNGYYATYQALKVLCPNLKVGDTAYLYATPSYNTINKYVQMIWEGGSELWNFGTSKTLTQTMLDAAVAFYGNRYTDGETQQLTLTDFIITKTQNANWEQFTNGASPNPDYPQDIEVVSGDNTININTKNFLPPITNETLSGVSVSQSENTITINGTSTNAINFTEGNVLLKAGTYRTNSRYISGTVTGAVQFILRKASNNENIVAFVYNATSYQNDQNSAFTLEQDTNLKYLIYIGGGDRTYNKFKFNIQVTQSASPDYDFVPYQKQEYSVNLGSLELCKIGDYKDKIKRSSGKNLFDKDNATTQVGYFSSDGTINSGGNSTLTTSYIPITPNTSFTLSGFAIERICFYGENKDFIERSDTVASNTYTFNKNAYFIRIQGTTTTFDLTKIQLEKGTQATTYEPYGKVWCKYKEIGKTILNGSEEWNKNNNYSTSEMLVVQNSISNAKTGSVDIANYFKYASPTIINSTRFAGQYLLFGLDINNFAYVSDFKTWLSTHNTTTYYVLNQATNEPITDTTLINQLNDLEKAYAYQNQTNISQQNNDKPFVIDAETCLDLSSVLNDLDLRIAALEQE